MKQLNSSQHFLSMSAHQEFSAVLSECFRFPTVLNELIWPKRIIAKKASCRYTFSIVDPSFTDVSRTIRDSSGKKDPWSVEHLLKHWYQTFYEGTCCAQMMILSKKLYLKRI
jgi:hypothetical protein